MLLPVIYPALYNGPVNYFARLVNEDRIVLEQYDHYTKQTYRNRCRILGPNNVITLTVPVKRKRGSRQYLKDIRIDYDTPWRNVHLRSIIASYASSPYFEYMRDELEACYKERYVFLLDLNLKLIRLSLSWMDLDIPIELSTSFEPLTGREDPRFIFHPKKKPAAVDPGFRALPYHQVFTDRHGFKANLSILDLLFNEGPGAPGLLRKCLRP